MLRTAIVPSNTDPDELMQQVATALSSRARVGCHGADDVVDASLHAFRDFVLVGRRGPSALAAIAGAAFAKGSIWLGCIADDAREDQITLDILDKALDLKEPMPSDHLPTTKTTSARQWLARRNTGVSPDDGWYLVNVSPRPALSCRLRFRVDKTMSVGSAEASTIRIGHACVLGTLCTLTEGADNILLRPQPGAAIRVNGVEVDEPISLTRGDAVVLGTTAQFVVARARDDVDGRYAYDADLPSSRGLCSARSLHRAVTLVAEANALADELGRDARFELKEPSPDDTEPSVVARSDRYDVADTWSAAKLESRICKMRRLRTNDKCSSEDPFYDPPDHRLVGVAFLYLDGLTYLMDVAGAVAIVDFRGERAGEIEVAVEPTLSNEEEEDEFAMNEEAHLKNHLGETLTVRIRVVRSVPAAKASFVRTTWFLNPQPLDTARLARRNDAYDAVFTVHQVITADFIDYVGESALELQVWSKEVRSLEV